MNKDELKRQCEVTDQMITIYSVLRDRYEIQATFLTLGILGSSVILVACTFLPDDALIKVGLSQFMIKVVLGATSSLVLFLSIAELRVDWKERSRRYADAADRLAKLKSSYRSALSDSQGISPDQIAALTHEYGQATEAIPRIPDKEFIRLKAYHKKKVMLSRMINESVGCPIWLLRLRLFLKGWRGKP